MGWQADVDQPHPDKYIICVAPHTSNWDFIIGLLYSRAAGFTSNFLMKKEWFFWPLGVLFRALGGIPVYRDKRHSLTDVLADEARRRSTFHLAVTPEGTRKRNADWKLGFYFIAYKAQLPILLYDIDYKHKRIRCRKTIIPDGDVERQMCEIKQYYAGSHGRHPDNFTTGL